MLTASVRPCGAFRACSIAWQAFLLACLNPTAVFAALPNGTAFNGVIPGEFSVSPTGAATYSVPIEVPPGIGGLEPQLSLEYSSQAGNGWLGVGWSLGGLSAVTRCPTTLVQDNVLDPVDFDGNDRLCLDGQRLIQVTNTGCAGGTEYRTEIDAYARICAYGIEGSGPAWLKVWSKAGQAMVYGTTADARIEAQGRSDVMVWALNRVTDTAGNYLDVTYHEDNANGEYYPLRIDYTANTSQGMAPYHSVRFTYEQRPDQASGWIGGSLTRSRVRMTNVQVYAGFDVIRDYRLAYETSSMTARSRLASLTLCAGEGYGAECQPATTLSWSDGTAGFAPAVNTGRGSTGSQYAQAMDVNGDGKTDLAYCTGATSTWQILISNGTGFNAPVNSGVLCTNYQYAVQIDYNSDGRMDLLVPYANSRWYVLRSTGTSFSVVDTGIPNSGWDTKPVVMDVNGDGRQDLVLTYSSQWVIRISNGNGFNAAVMTGINNVNWQYRLEIDYNGDGMMDLLVPYANNRWYVLRSSGSNFQLVDTGISSIGFDNQPQILDVNGDGLQDLVLSHTNRRWVSLNRGGSLSPGVDAGVADIGSNKSYYRLDYDGDGKEDLFVAYLVSSTCTPGYVCQTILYPRWSVLRSNGSGFELIDIPSAVNADLRSGDFNGDGFTDLALAYSNVWNLLRHSPGIPDQLSAIADGADGTTNITYKPLTDTSVYTKGAIPAYPQQSLQAPLYVVSEFSASNGVGSANIQRYTYADARVDLRGRGFLGFRTMTTVNDASQIRTQMTYSQAFPYIGLITGADKWRVSASSPLNSLSNNWDNIQPYSGVYQVRLSYSYEATNELSGSNASIIETVYDSYDAFGNAQQIDINTMGDGGLGGYSDRSTTNTYANDVNQWRLARLTRSTVTSYTPSGTETRTSAFEYDASTGLLSAEIIEPDAPQLLLRTEYGYDGYGNKTSMTVRDSGGNSYPISVATSTTSYDYSALSAYGTYSVTSTNAKGHTETQVIAARFGKPLSLTGPNGLITQWEYNSFGRQTREIRADGTQTITDAVWCNSTCAGVAHVIYKATTHISGSAPTAVYLDGFNREVRGEAVGFSGQAVFKDTQYNALGQVARVSRPYQTGMPRWTDYQYDDLGRVIKETSPDGGIVETTYNGSRTSLRRYDVSATYDQTVTRFTDVEGNLLRVTDESNQGTFYQYDPFGNLTQVTDPANNVTVMAYDRRGRKTGMDDPDMGHWEYRYDALGQLRWQQDAKNQVTTMEYDVLGRLTRRVQPEGASYWTYDTRSKGIGKLSQISGPDGYIERYYYDGYGRPKESRQVIGGTTLTTATVYDAYSRVLRTSYPSGFILRHQYNAQGHLYRLVNNANTAERYWTAQAADAEGHITQELLGNSLSTVRTFDPASGRLSYLGTYGGTTTVQMLNYQYDALGNLKGREDVIQNLSETFQYDAFNRLTQTTIAGVGTKTWSYDGLGNITSKDGYSDYAYASGRPHAVSYARGSAYTYDTNGNMTGGGGRVITWTSDNKPKRITKGSAVAEFNYTPDGARYKQVSTVGGVSTTTLYAGSHHEQVTVNGVTTHKDYLSAGGRVVAIRETVNSNVSMKYLHQDHLGSTDVITNASGQVLERQSFDAFGSRRVATTWRDPVGALTSMLSTRGFTGHEQLDGTGLIHMNGRVYDPQLGRFLSADPYIGAPANPQNLNRYSYVNNNPLSYTDPSGYFFKKLVNAVKKIFKNPIVRAVAGIVLGALTYGALSNLWIPFGQITAGAAGGFVGGFVASGGNLKAGLYGAVTGGIFAGVANFASGQGWGEGTFGRTMLHAFGGGVSSRIQGGGFRDGFLSAGFAQRFAPLVGGIGGRDMAGVIGRTVASAVIGGTASELGGGKFANGARTAAFARLFNAEHKLIAQRVGVGSTWWDPTNETLPESATTNGLDITTLPPLVRMLRSVLPDGLGINMGRVQLDRVVRLWVEKEATMGVYFDSNGSPYSGNDPRYQSYWMPSRETGNVDWRPEPINFSTPGQQYCLPGGICSN